MPDRFRALILLTTFACLRWGEVIALQRQDLDTDTGTVRVRHAFSEQRGTGLVLGPPKSRAGDRIVSVPAVILPTLRKHLETYTGEEAAAFVFTGEAGRPIWRGSFNKLVKWTDVVQKIDMPGLHFHDLRHTGNTLAARTGASTRDLMARMGHDSVQAALIYQRATVEADRAIAAAVDRAVKSERKKATGKTKKAAKRRSEEPDDGATGVLARQR